jgi:hypothetical protein
MTINKTAYNTTACIGYRQDKIAEAIKIAYYSGAYDNVPDYNIRTIIGGMSESNNIPVFAHPILVELDKEEEMFIDVRSFGSFNKDQQDFKITNPIDHSLLLARAKLNYIWVHDDVTYLRNISLAPMAIYAAWISEAIAKRYALDAREQLTIGILAAIFYNSQFINADELDERDKLRTINTVSRALRASAQDVIYIIDKVSVMKNVFDFCMRAQEITDSVRLKDFNAGVLFTLLGNTWFGANAKEMIAVATEHPPTWIAMLLSAFTERTFKNSQIAKILERNSFKKLSDDFVNSTLNLISISATK